MKYCGYTLPRKRGKVVSALGGTRRYLQHVLNRFGGSVTQAAKVLEITANALRKHTSPMDSAEGREMAWKRRVLSDDFLAALKSGVLSPLLERVQQDDTLDIELRGNDHSINVYYRGGSLSKVTQQGKKYRIKFDDRYFNTPLGETLRPAAPLETISSSADCKLLTRNIPLYKQVIDAHRTRKRASEREFQQLLVKENNLGAVAKSSDYFICDIEYQNDFICQEESSTRLDLVGAFWPADRARKLRNTARLAIFEMKYGIGAYTGKSGIVHHLETLRPFLENTTFIGSLKEEMVQVMQQKMELGLLPALEHFMPRFSFSEERPEYILVFANHKPRSTQLARTLQEVPVDYPADIKVAVSTFMGYGLFLPGIFGKDVFCKVFTGQICSRIGD